MSRGVTLVELMVSLLLASLITLGIYSMNRLFTSTYKELHATWYCLQSIRNSVAFLDRDLKQCAYLLPQDLKVACGAGHLYLAGPPVTSRYSGLQLPANSVPPCYAVVLSSGSNSLRVDTVDIDGNAVPDFWADLGIITENGAAVIAHNYTRGVTTIPLTAAAHVVPGERVVPAVHYELKGDGLYRNAQLLAEAITDFRPVRHHQALTIYLKAQAHDKQRTLSYSYHLD